MPPTRAVPAADVLAQRLDRRVQLEPAIERPHLPKLVDKAAADGLTKLELEVHSHSVWHRPIFDQASAARIGSPP